MANFGSLAQRKVLRARIVEVPTFCRREWLSTAMTTVENTPFRISICHPDSSFLTTAPIRAIPGGNHFGSNLVPHSCHAKPMFTDHLEQRQGSVHGQHSRCFGHPRLNCLQMPTRAADLSRCRFDCSTPSLGKTGVPQTPGRASRELSRGFSDASK